MITCGECGKTNGDGRIGNHWICGDCKVEKASSLETRMEPSEERETTE